MAPPPVPPPADEAGGAPPLVVQDASLQTAALEFQAVLLGGRRLTLAGFRQLQEEPLIDDATGQPRGRIWGWVNYHPDRCTADPPHRHVLWQLGSELRRARVPTAALDADPLTAFGGPELARRWGQPFADVSLRVMRRLRLCALCLCLTVPDASFAPPREGDGAAAEGDAPRRTRWPWTRWRWWADSPDPADREVGHAIWNHERFRVEEFRAWSGVPPDAAPSWRGPTEAELRRALALADWIGDVEARGIRVVTGERDADGEFVEFDPSGPDDEATGRLLLVGPASIHDVDLPLLFGTPDAPDGADALDLPVCPVAACPADDWEGERLELAPVSCYDEHPPTGHRRAPGGPRKIEPGYVRITRTFPAVVQAISMVEARVSASRRTSELTQLLEQYAQDVGIPVAYVRDADHYQEPMGVTEETLEAASAAFNAALEDRDAFGGRLAESGAAVRAAPQLFVAV